ncbi:carbon-nitrogen hydrolase family protein [Chakrabartyella piscis]|uniref:carbon-nitrogen hydrolase family protein n=1 Tax=Chakrabartyella piscis TaxID=2918914 RepID=UPI002958B703|nr:carbon-nitrogen hydrolase family protein [Chakrabartyella piscis]
MKIALVQMNVVATPKDNLAHAKELLQEAKNLGADIAVLPEIFICGYNNACFPEHAQPENSPFMEEMAKMVGELGIYLVAGSIPELDGDLIYNTSYVYNPQGEIIAKHRKMHLFDIDVKGGQYFKESDVLSPGDTFTTFATPWGKMGLMICFDIRFPELARLLTLDGAKGIFVPAAFNMTTGPAHWELSFRARAMDNQVYMAGVSPARNTEASYVAYGHSISTSPWGDVIHQMDVTEGVAIVEWDLEQVDRIREQLPFLSGRRRDLYELQKK